MEYVIIIGFVLFVWTCFRLAAYQPPAPPNGDTRDDSEGGF